MAPRDASDAAAVVTGHTRGLGAAIAAGLLARGARVLGVARGRNDELAAPHAARLTQVKVDLSDPVARAAVLRGDALGRFLHGARVALLVNNAGVLQPIGPLDTQDVEAIARAVEVNVAAPLALSAAFVVATADAPDRRILHVSSGAARQAYAGWSVYCASKAALDQHARAVALDRTPRLRIGSVAPGVIDTRMQAEIRASSEASFPDRERFVALEREGRLLKPETAGEALVDFLLADDFGSEVVVDLRKRGR